LVSFVFERDLLLDESLLALRDLVRVGQLAKGIHDPLLSDPDTGAEILEPKGRRRFLELREDARRDFILRDDRVLLLDRISDHLQMRMWIQCEGDRDRGGRGSRSVLDGEEDAISPGFAQVQIRVAERPDVTRATKPLSGLGVEADILPGVVHEEDRGLDLSLDGPQEGEEAGDLSRRIFISCDQLRYVT